MAGAPDSSSPIWTMCAAHTTQFDYDADGNPIFIGLAPPSITTSTANWQIRKVTWTSGNPNKIEYADGNDKFDNKWDDRAGLSYS